ncbi:hypothetical protein ES703_89704 [subsurface metagenome]
MSLNIEALPGPPEICHLPPSFDFTASEGGPNPPDQNLWIGNCGEGTLEWSVSDDAAWLSLDPASGTSTGEMDKVILSVDIAGMGAGGYSATITIQGPGATNSPQTALVSLNIEALPGPPEICHLPPSFDFTASEGGPNPPDQSLDIWNCGEGTLEWSVSDDAAWLSLSPLTGSSTGEMDKVILSVDITGMGPGGYSATITIQGPGATNSPQTASVSLTISMEGYEPGGSTEPPCRFYGTVQVDGAYVPDGTPITATVDGAGTWTTVNFTYTGSPAESVYVLDVPGDDPLTPEKDGGVEGDAVTFTIIHGSTDLAAGSGIWHKGIPQEVNLHATTHIGGGGGGGGGGGAPTPTPPAEPAVEEPEEPVTPPEPAPSPEPTPPAPEELADEGPSGLAPGAWAGIGIGSALLLALVAWLILRRWVWTGS